MRVRGKVECVGRSQVSTWRGWLLAWVRGVWVLWSNAVVSLCLGFEDNFWPWVSPSASLSLSFLEEP